MNHPPKVPPDSGVLQLAAVCYGTQALGPGLRAAVWVQGCPFRCPGCIAPQWLSFDHPARRVKPEVLAEELLADPQISGLTFSGGEPFMQARGLARLAKLARQKRDLNIICFTGYQLEQLIRKPPESGVFDLLDEIDVLIDGPYIAERNDGRGLRGSDNQRIIYLTSRLAGYDFHALPRRVELQVLNGQMMVVGIPPVDVLQVLDATLPQGVHLQAGLFFKRLVVNDERA